MNLTAVLSQPTNFAIQLLPADPLHPQRITGRLEHVLSGRRYDFGDGLALLALLSQEQGLSHVSNVTRLELP